MEVLELCGSCEQANMKNYRQYAVRGTRAKIPGLMRSSHYSLTVTPVFNSQLGESSKLSFWTDPGEPPEPELPKVFPKGFAACCSDVLLFPGVLSE